MARIKGPKTGCTRWPAPWVRSAAAVAFFAAGPAASGLDCPCTPPEVMVARLHRVASPDWKQVDRTTLVRVWPEVAVAPCGPDGDPLEALVAEGQRCSKAGGELGISAFGPGGSKDGNLLEIDVHLTRPTKRQTMARLRELIGAVHAGRPAASYRDGWDPSDPDDRGAYLARWQVRGETFALEARTGGVDGESHGWFRLLRLTPPDVRETWTLEDGRLVRVLSLETTRRPDSPVKVLRLRYLTECFYADLACVGNEVRRLWPRLQALADEQEAREITLWIDDGVMSQAHDAKRSTNGEWTGSIPFLFRVPTEP